MNVCPRIARIAQKMLVIVNVGPQIVQIAHMMLVILSEAKDLRSLD